MRGAHATWHWLDRRVLLGAAAVVALVGGASFAAMNGSGGSRGSRADGPARPPAPASPSSPAAAPAAVDSPSASPPASPSAATPSPSGAAARPTTTPAPPAGPVRAGSQGQRVKLLKLINQQRRDNGQDNDNLAPLATNSDLQSAAQTYAEHLAADGQLSHADGSLLGDRVTATGYRWSVVGEDLARSQLGPTEVVAAWMKSPDDRSNILNPAFADIGIGIAIRPDGQIVWCVDFAAPR